MKGGEKMQAQGGAEGVKFEEAGMRAAQETLDKTAEELKKKLEDFVAKTEEEIGENGSIWSGNQAKEFISKVKNEQVPEIEKCHENIHSQAANIKDQADRWVEFDEQ